MYAIRWTVEYHRNERITLNGFGIKIDKTRSEFRINRNPFVYGKIWFCRGTLGTRKTLHAENAAFGDISLEHGLLIGR